MSWKAWGLFQAFLCDSDHGCVNWAWRPIQRPHLPAGTGEVRPGEDRGCCL